MISKSTHPRRPGFTLMEILVSIGILSGLMIAVAQTANWCYYQRTRNHAEYLALQMLQNIQEEGKAVGFDKITPVWAANLKDLSRYGSIPPACRVQASVSLSPESKYLKEIQVEISWKAGVPLEEKKIQSVFWVSSRVGAEVKP